METILDPRRLAPLVKVATRVALENPRIRSTLARGETFVRSVRANPAYKATAAAAAVIAARLKASPSLSGALASGLAIVVFVSISPLVFRTGAPVVKTIPAPVAAPATPAPTVPTTPAPGATTGSGKTSGGTGQKTASSAAPSTAPSAAPSTTPSRPQATHRNPEPFIERFKALDNSRWYFADRGPNGDWTANDFRRSQLSVTHEGLNLTMAKMTRAKGPPYSSGEISTLQTFRYGYFEARVRMPRGTGIDTGLFTYVREKGPTGWNEIDIEFIGKNPRQVELALHVGKQVAHYIVALPFDPADGFHTYAFDWQPNSVTWYIDGKNVHEERGAVAAGLTRPQNLLFDLWGSETLPQWMGKLDPKGGPRVATISCFAYDKAYANRSLCSDADTGMGKAEGAPRVGLK